MNGATTWTTVMTKFGGEGQTSGRGEYQAQVNLSYWLLIGHEGISPLYNHYILYSHIPCTTYPVIM